MKFPTLSSISHRLLRIWKFFALELFANVIRTYFDGEFESEEKERENDFKMYDEFRINGLEN